MPAAVERCRHGVHETVDDIFYVCVAKISVMLEIDRSVAAYQRGEMRVAISAAAGEAS